MRMGGRVALRCPAMTRYNGMQLRTFLAKDMRAALADVRSAMGPEAVIVASQSAKGGGVMVRAALEEPEPPLELSHRARPLRPRSFDQIVRLPYIVISRISLRATSSEDFAAHSPSEERHEGRQIEPVDARWKIA